MCRQTCIWLLVAVLVLPALSCTRLPEKPVREDVTVASEQLPALDCIPPEWGKLVSVTSNPSSPGWFQLWFEDEMSTVRMTAFNYRTRRFDSDVIVLPRR